MMHFLCFKFLFLTSYVERDMIDLHSKMLNCRGIDRNQTSITFNFTDLHSCTMDSKHSHCGNFCSACASDTATHSYTE